MAVGMRTRTERTPDRATTRADAPGAWAPTRGGPAGASPSGAPALPAWLPALLQLASPALPTGAFAYSQGLESAAHAGLVHDEASAGAWIESAWCNAFAVRESPVVGAAWHAFDAGDTARLEALDASFVASRDAAEARAETRQVGAALARWLATQAPGSPAARVAQHLRPAAPVAFALCGASQGLDASTTRAAYDYAWLENQVQAAVKIVPLGQTSGQRLLVALRPRVLAPSAAPPWSFAPVAAIMAMRHERLYTRLFRS